jgi:hypothetical protein
VGPRAGLDVCGKSRPHQDLIPGPSIPYPVAIPIELPGPHKQILGRKVSPFLQVTKALRESRGIAVICFLRPRY